MTRMSSTAESLARAALTYVDEFGVEPLTIRALGKAVGMHHTAIYRHYRSKNELLRAVLALVIEETFAQAGTLPEDPKEKIFTLASGLRGALNEHPAVTVAYLLPVETLADSQVVTNLQGMLVGALRDLGLSGHDLLIRYQMLESYTLGACVFDYGGAPDHVDSRRRRHRMVADPDFDAMTRSNEAVEAISESAFELGLRTLVEECAAAGKSQGARHGKAGAST